MQKDEIIKGLEQQMEAVSHRFNAGRHTDEYKKHTNQAISILKRIDEGEIFKILVENILVTDTVRIAYGGKVAKAIVKWIMEGR